jgi:hypothetical protein
MIMVITNPIIFGHIHYEIKDVPYHTSLNARMGESYNKMHIGFRSELQQFMLKGSIIRVTVLTL